MTRPALLAIVLTSSLIWPASAAPVHKVIEADGSIVYTDVPQPPGSPRYEITAPDQAVARANAQVDRAEHELAVARQGLWSPELNLSPERMTPADRSRVEYCKRGVQIAHQQLMELLRERRASPPG
ncbi:MAG: hypothetical protein WA190_11565 [Usitatibacter sp.]